MSKPTPGPWQWYWRREEGEATCGVFWAEREGMAYSVCRAPRYAKKEEWEANARLIAAAPELLEALIACATHIAAADGKDGAQLRLACAAIAKATGEQP